MVADPVMAVSMLLELMECERSWIAKALFCTGMSVYIPVYENGHYCAAYIDAGTKCVYWIDSLDIRQRAAGDVASACSVMGLDFVDLKVSWQRDSWSCGVWCVMSYLACVEFEMSGRLTGSFDMWFRQAQVVVSSLGVHQSILIMFRRLTSIWVVCTQMERILARLVC